MNATELRIGNWITAKDYKKPFQVAANTFADIIQRFLAGTEIHKPICITKEWLIKFGFELKHIDEDDTFGSYQLLIPKTAWYLANAFTYDVITLWNIRDNTSTGVGVQYIHQLQNLYFALTGKELELNTSTIQK